MLRTLAVVAACVGVNGSPVPARPVQTLSAPFWGGDTPKTKTAAQTKKAYEARHPHKSDDKKATAHKAASTTHKATPTHSLDDGHGHKAPKHTAPKHTAPKHTLDDGHTHSSPELVTAPAAAEQAHEAQLPARKLTTEEKAAQEASEAREAMAVAAEAERAKAEAKKLSDEEKRIADSEADRMRVEKVQRAAEPKGLAARTKKVQGLVSDEDFDPSKCVGISGTEKDNTWCVASCGAIVKPDCPSSFCTCETAPPNDSSLTDAATTRDAGIADRDAGIADRDAGGAVDAAVAERDANVAKRDTGAPQAATSDADAGFDASTCVGLSGTEKDAAWCVASCGAPNKPDCPTNFCKCEGEAGHDSSITKRDEAAAAAADAAGEKDAFDASTCKGVSGTKKDTDWCVASCGAPLKPDCPSTVCACEGEVPFDSSLTGSGSADRDAEVAKRDAEIAKRGAGGASAASDADDAAGEEADATTDAGTGFDASTCVGVSGTEKDAAWCVASCGAPNKPDCPSTFCTCEGDVGHDSSVRDGTADGEMSDAAAATADAIAQRDAGIASRGAGNSKDPAAGESAALSDPTFDGSSCHRVQEHVADQPGNNDDDDKWCKDHCSLTPSECPALFCKCDPPTYDLPPNMEDTEGEGAHVKGGMVPSKP